MFVTISLTRILDRDLSFKLFLIKYVFIKITKIRAICTFLFLNLDFFLPINLPVGESRLSVDWFHQSYPQFIPRKPLVPHLRARWEFTVSRLIPSARCTRPIGPTAPVMVGRDSDWSLWLSFRATDGDDWLTFSNPGSRLVDVPPPGCLGDRQVVLMLWQWESSR